MPIEFAELITQNDFYLLSGFAGCLGAGIFWFFIGQGL